MYTRVTTGVFNITNVGMKDTFINIIQGAENGVPGCKKREF